MKNILKTFCVTFFIFSCNGQEKDKTITYPKEATMITEKFDIDRFKDYPDFVSEDQKQKLPSTKDSLSDGTIVEYSWQGSKNSRTQYTKIIIPPPPTLFKMVKDFYPTGVIRKETKVFIGNLRIQPFYNNLITKDYDEKGYLVKTTDHSNFDQNLEIKFIDLLKILEKEPIIRTIDKSNIDNIYNGLFHGKISKENITSEKVIDYLKSDDCNGNILNSSSDFERRNITISIENNN